MTDSNPEAPSSPPAPSSWRDSFLSPLKHRTYRHMWLANLGSYLGGMIQATGASWMMTTLTRDASLISLVQGSMALSTMLFSVLSGAIADSFHRRTVMLVANVFMLIASLLLLVMAYTGQLTPWWLLSFTFLVGCGGTLNAPAWQASVGDLVPRDDLPAAVTLNSVCFNLSRSAGPALGGVIIAVSGVVASFAANALSYLGVIGVLARWPKAEGDRTLPRERIGRAVLLGLRYAVMSPNLARVLLRGYSFGLAAISATALLPVVARNLVHGGPRTFGLMLGAFGVGGLLGAVLNNRMRSSMSNEWVVRVGFLLMATGLGIIALSKSLILSCGGLLICGAAWVLTLSLLNVTVQLSSPRWVVGRMLAIYQTAVFGGFLTGSWLWGTVAERFSVASSLGFAALVLVAGAAIGLICPVPEEMVESLTPSGTWREPKLALDILPNSGPVMIEAEFTIKEEDIPEFLFQIEKRRRARLRDGAHHWMMVRDLHEPERWRISYQFPTWLEYVRHSLRITEQDAIAGEDLRALHQGPQPLKVRRLIERQTIVHPPSAVES